jgi:hypothetical protein
VTEIEWARLPAALAYRVARPPHAGADLKVLLKKTPWGEVMSQGRETAIILRTKYIIALLDSVGDEKFLGGETWETKCWVEDIQQAMMYVHKWTAEEMCKVVEVEEDLDNCYVVDVLCSVRGMSQIGK